jgi:WhiB family redox-sensing transcriptional regulator
MATTAPARPGRARVRSAGPVTITQPNWERYARCAGLQTDFFFSEDEEDRAYAKSICRRCPVEDDCLAHAIQQRELGGVWGGRTESERFELMGIPTQAPDVGHGYDEDGDDGTAAA